MCRKLSSPGNPVLFLPGRFGVDSLGDSHFDFRCGSPYTTLCVSPTLGRGYSSITKVQPQSEDVSGVGGEIHTDLFSPTMSLRVPVWTDGPECQGGLPSVGRRRWGRTLKGV